MKKSKAFKPTMDWNDVVHFLAQGAVNVAEEMTMDSVGNKGCFIQNRSPIHKAMIGFCDHLSTPEGRRIVAEFMSRRNE
jgi:hypothetical protein